MELVLEGQGLPVEAGLRIADPLHGLADGLLDLFLHARCPVAGLVHDALAANLAGEDDELGRRQRLAGDARLRILRKEQVDDRVRNLVGDLVRMALGDGFGREHVAAAHKRDGSFRREVRI